MEGVSQRNASGRGPERAHPSAATVASWLQHQTRRCLHSAAGVGGGPLHDTSKISTPTHSSSGNNTCTPHGAPQATNQTKLLHFYIPYALFQPGGKKEHCIFKAGALKIDGLQLKSYFLHKNTKILRQSQRKPCSSRGPHRKVL